MIITAFDLATATGCCDGQVGGKSRLWSWYLDDAGPGRPARLYHLAKFLRKYFETQPCDAVVYEAPQPLPVMARIGATDHTVAFLRGAIGVLEMTCAEYKIKVDSVTVGNARSSVLGWRLNKTGIKTKKRVMDDVARLGVKAENDNESDAFVCWQYACNLMNPRLAVAMTPLFKDMRDEN